MSFASSTIDTKWPIPGEGYRTMVSLFICMFLLEDIEMEVDIELSRER